MSTVSMRSDILKVTSSDQETGYTFYWCNKTSNREKCIWCLFCSHLWCSAKNIWTSQTSKWPICYEGLSNSWMNVFLTGKKICHFISKGAFIYNASCKAFNKNSNSKKHVLTYTTENNSNLVNFSMPLLEN